MNKPKEQAITDFTEMIKNAWPLKRFTAQEKESFKSLLYWLEHSNRLTGNYDQRWEQAQTAYNAFLYAIDYKPIGWRDNDDH